MNHHFVKFSVPEDISEKTRYFIDDYLDQLKNWDISIVFHSLREKTAVYQEIDNELKEIDRNENEELYRSFTLMIITKNIYFGLPKPKGQIISCAAGELIYLKKEFLLFDELESKRCKWMIGFCEKFENIFQDPRFFELRPEQ